jgi:hypothetical protein
MEPDRALGLFKFGQSEHIKQFRLGRLYMNPLSYFVSVEDQARQDKREGQSFWLQPNKATLAIEIGGAYEPIPGIIGPIAVQHERDLKPNVFCMHALRASVAKELVDPRAQS